MGATSFTRSLNTHLPASKQWPQAMHPRMSLFPTWTSSVSTPSAANTFSISLRARAVLPLGLGLPLSISTFITVSPLTWACGGHASVGVVFFVVVFFVADGLDAAFFAAGFLAVVFFAADVFPVLFPAGFFSASEAAAS